MPTRTNNRSVLIELLDFIKKKKYYWLIPLLLLLLFVGILIYVGATTPVGVFFYPLA